MASRESSQRGDAVAIADHKRLGPGAIAGGDGELAQQPACFIGRRVGGKIAELLLERRGVRRGGGAGQAQCQGAAPRQAAEHAGLGAQRAGGRVVGGPRQDLVGLEILAGLEQEAAAAQPIGGRRGRLPQRGRPIRGPHHLGTGLGGLAGGPISVRQRLPDVRRLVRVGHERGSGQVEQGLPPLERRPARSSLIQPNRSDSTVNRSAPAGRLAS